MPTELGGPGPTIENQKADPEVVVEFFENMVCDVEVTQNEDGEVVNIGASPQQ